MALFHSTKRMLFSTKTYCFSTKLHVTSSPNLVYKNVPSLFECNRHSSKLYFQQIRSVSSTKMSWFRKKVRGYEIVEPAEVNKEPRRIFENIKKPPYAETGVVDELGDEIEIKNEKQIHCMRKSCALARKILDEVSSYVQVGRTTDELDGIVHSLCNSYGAYPSPLNYRGYPKSVCTSVNNIACHGIPDSRRLRNGDIISIDVSVYYNGYHGDCAATYGVGNVDRKGQLLMSVASQCLDNAIRMCYAGQRFSNIGRVISEFAHSHGFSVIPAFCGHGIGSYFHGPPNIMHCVNESDQVMQEGMTFTIEPVICEGEPDILVLDDGWSATTEDYSRSAQFEHTVLINKHFAEILTKPGVFNSQE